ncbi:alpha/beta-hydrolase [Trematosphaeria pertusa]|uniref:Alpha/beta-hydrolase n=1 Tax=Trematosphaeria pertusa TaxID=390896 RepID=A0A6A6I3G5_9PLEO|nr:alpha/beta-hydrolase [Trematosphaeria pertusa]KAF2245025.1 alpha/beta-hydrolase [Trematosphaeria pertusa]
MASSRTELIEVQPNVKINAVISEPPGLPIQHELPSVVFLHFWGGSASTWSLVTPLVSTHYPSVALDFRGWGSSTGPADPNAYSIEALARDVEAVIAALNLHKVVLVGMSMGAKVAQLVAARLCSRASKGDQATVLLGVVLVSPAPPTPLVLPPEMRKQQLRAYDDPDSAMFVARNVLTATFRSRDLPNFVVGDMLQGNKWAREAWPAYAMAEDVSEAAAKIAVPVLVLAAEEDIVEPLERVQREVCARIPEAKVAVLAETGHLSPLDAPDVVTEHLLEFLDGL